MESLPEEYVETINNASLQLTDIAKTVMFVAGMLGNDIFELDTPDGFNIVIRKQGGEVITVDKLGKI